MLLDACGIVSAALFLPSEGDYELIPEPRGSSFRNGPRGD